MNAGYAAFALVLTFAAGCATESHTVVETESVATYNTSYAGPKYALGIGHFENRSPYMRGLFSDGNDRLGGQAKTILKTHLSQSGRFNLVDRSNMEALARESEISGGAQMVRRGQDLAQRYDQTLEEYWSYTGSSSEADTALWWKHSRVRWDVEYHIDKLSTLRAVYSIFGMVY